MFELAGYPEIEIGWASFIDWYFLGLLIGTEQLCKKKNPRNIYIKLGGLIRDPGRTGLIGQG